MAKTIPTILLPSKQPPVQRLMYLTAISSPPSYQHHQENRERILSLLEAVAEERL
jgi:hypothetical protein